MTNRGTSSRSPDSSSKNQPQNNAEIEVLFEWQEYRNIIKSKRSQLLDKITENLACVAGQSDVQVHTLQSSRKGTPRGKQKKSQYLLQRYINDWKTHVNVDSIDQVKNRDCLTIMAKPSSATELLSSQNETAAKPKVRVCRV